MIRKYLQICILIGSVFITSTRVNAQIVGSNCFLKGNFAEVGLNTCGVFGSDAAAPAGYHPNVGSYLGFVADSDMDGWAVGTPDYCGDYFIPGTPEEGFAIQVGSDVYVNTNQFCAAGWGASYDIPGSVTGYNYTAGIYSMTWEGDIASENMHVTQTTELPEDKLYFVTTITMCNTGGTDISEVYYMRNVDPDQDQPFGWSFMTTNTIESNPPDNCEAVVTAEGDVYGCFLGMGAINPDARASMGCFFTTDGTPYNAWHGLGGIGWTCSGDDYDTDVGDTKYCDCATQISFYLPTIAAGDCEEFKFVYILDLDFLDEALLATGSYSVEADSVTINNGDTVQICTLDTLTLEIINGENFEWVWTPAIGLDYDTGTLVHATPDVTTTYVATGYADCDTVTYAVTVEVPPPPMADAGPDLNLCFGDTIQIDASGGVTYAWNPPTYLSDPFAEDPFVEAPPTNMFYQLVVYNILGCTDTDDVAVFLYPDPIIDAGEDQLMMLGGFANLNATGGTTYVWSPDTWLSDVNVSDPTTYAEDTIVYYVTGTDANGCVAVDSVTIFVLEDMDIISPSAFTPNGDGLNDYYHPLFIGMGEITGYSIYNRWGSLIFESSDLHLGWDGTYRSQDQEVGTYLVNIRGINKYGEIINKTITLALLR